MGLLRWIFHHIPSVGRIGAKNQVVCSQSRGSFYARPIIVYRLAGAGRQQLIFNRCGKCHTNKDGFIFHKKLPLQVINRDCSQEQSDYNYFLHFVKTFFKKSLLSVKPAIFHENSSEFKNKNPPIFWGIGVLLRCSKDAHYFRRSLQSRLIIP